MSSQSEANCLRFGVALNRAEHVSVVRITGEDAFELADRVSPRPLFLRDGRMLPGLLLSEDGTVFADVYFCAQDLDWILLVEGPTGGEVVAWLSKHLHAGEDVEILDLTTDTSVIGLHGPYSWELMAELIGPGAVSMPYLSSFELPEWDGVVYRSGKTGEYGYLLCVPCNREAELVAEVERVGEEFEAGWIGVEALDLAALENGFFCIRLMGIHGLTPVELQLLWRIAWDRTAPGTAALRAHRHKTDHVTWIRLEATEEAIPTSGQKLTADGISRGWLVDARWSPLLDGAIGLALLDGDCVPGTVLDGAIVTAPPLLVNRSLTLNPERHSFASRELDEFPPLVGPAP
jgi:aminomethyltransferase